MIRELKRRQGFQTEEGRPSVVTEVTVPVYLASSFDDTCGSNKTLNLVGRVLWPPTMKVRNMMLLFHQCIRGSYERI